MKQVVKYAIICMIANASAGLLCAEKSPKKERSDRYREIAAQVTRNLQLGNGCVSAEVAIIDDEIYEILMSDGVKK